MNGPDDLPADVWLALLRGYDDPRSLAAPAGFDYLEATERFLQLAHDVTRIVGRECEIEVWPAVQDASFHGEIRLPDAVLMAPGGVFLRASNFGNLVTAFDADEAVRPDVMAAVRGRADRHGYRYVPSAVLRRPYTGRHAGTTAIRDWGGRFFGYV
jgi:hypothetical protein